MICEVLSVKTLAQRKYKVGAVCTQDVLEVAFDADPKDLRTSRCLFSFTFH